MKKTACFFFILLVCLSAFAQFNLLDDGSLTLQLVSFNPLYEESVTDPYSYNTKLSYDYALNTDKRPTEVLCVIKDVSGETPKTDYGYLPIDSDYYKDDSRTYINMKPSLALAFLRLEYENPDLNIPKLQFEVNLDGYINTVFCGFGRNHTLDFDGSFFIGATAKAYEKYALRFGIHHFSGHYGDEIIEKMFETNKIDFSQTLDHNGTSYGARIGDSDKYFISPVEYVRDNSWLISASADVLDYVRLYGSLEIPMNPSWLRPLAHCPANYKNPATKEKDPSMIERIGFMDRDDSEFFEDAELDAIEEAKDKSYKALRAQLGVEFEYDFNDFTAFASADLQLHQDGKTKHNPYGYSKTNKWDKEVSVAAGVFLKSPDSPKKVGLEALYHTGRFNATQWFYQDYESVSIAMIIK